jgi:Fe-S cluster biogenesis protein NfuA
MKEQVQDALNEIRPSLQADGGDVELVDVEDGIVKVRLTGACGGCPMSRVLKPMSERKSLKLSASSQYNIGTITYKANCPHDPE